MTDKTGTLRNILVHLDHGERCVARLELAADMARAHGARLVGLFAECAKAHQVGIVAHWPSETYKAAAAASRADFARVADGLPAAEWRDANRGSVQEVTQAVIEAAHNFDVVILGQDGGDVHTPAPTGMAEQVILHAGRPALVVPFAGAVGTIGRRPLIAWNHSRESARALNDALPLMAGATEEATVVSFSANPSDERAVAAQCVAHLAAHGIGARVEVLVPEGIGLMDLLLNRAADVGADLLVMGAHANLGFPFLHRGGGTRHVLAHMTLPVLMSN